ncbi:restriction endonuclease subunit S [Yersinia ruckeri]|uniref:restriction endonuclease subunit S n=1 Tax=Yersinia ruckeri TaxID=29486 RepID=UPI001F2F7C31|nr:restriction endonuclease subunit S [Yersinia ruckeri]UIM97938.1 restriction endonuclease subunit S [Yersinia ruckeri]
MSGLKFHIPDSWKLSKLPDIAEINMGQSPSSSDVNEHGEGMVFFQGKAEFGKLYPIPRKYCTKPTKTASAGSILLSVRAPVGPTNIATQTTAIGRGLAAISACDGLTDPKYLLYYFRYIEPWLSTQGTGSTFKAISGTFIKELVAPTTSFYEQKILAEKLDTLLAQVDSTKIRLEQIPKILKRFRQAVLATAVSGKLTESFRAKSNYSIINLHLSKISKEVCYAKSWTQCLLKDCCNIISGNAFKSSDFTEGVGIPVIKISNIQYGQFEIKNQQFLPSDFQCKFNSFEVRAGDILMALTRPITNNTLKVCRYPQGQTAGLLNQRVCKFIFKNNINTNFFELLFQSDYFKLQVEDNLSETLQPNLSPNDLKNFMIFLPPLPEQQEIVRRVEQLFAYADTIEKQVNSALDRVNNLTPSILAKAFRGELTTQWRAENPDLISGENSATALLEKIKADRAASGSKKASRKKT